MKGLYMTIDKYKKKVIEEKETNVDSYVTARFHRKHVVAENGKSVLVLLDKKNNIGAWIPKSGRFLKDEVGLCVSVSLMKVWNFTLWDTNERIAAGGSITAEDLCKALNELD